MYRRLRARVWPTLLGVDLLEVPEDITTLIRPHKDERQVDVDVARSLWNMPRGLAASDRERMRRKLSNVINALLSTNPDLCYYQGLHDIVSVLLVSMHSERLAYACIAALARSHLRDFMMPNLRTPMAFADLLYPLLARTAPDVHDHITRADVQPYFMIAWLLTWMSHVLDDWDTAALIFDHCIASHPLFILYLAAAIVIHRRHELLSEDCEYGALYKRLLALPPDLRWPTILAQAHDLLAQHPPAALAALPAVLPATHDIVQHSTALCYYPVFEAAVRRGEHGLPPMPTMRGVLLWSLSSAAALAAIALPYILTVTRSA